MRETPVQQSFDEFFDNFAQRMNTCIPGYIESWNAEEKTAVVNVPFIDYVKTSDGTPDARQKSPVPVFCVYPRGGGWSIIHPLKKGDPVMVFFAQRSIDEWAASDGKTDVSPQELDMFSSSDAFIIPGLFPSGNNTGKANETDLILSHEDGTELRLGKDKKIHAVCDRLNIGADSASTALAKAAQTNSRLSALESTINTMIPALLATFSIPPGVVFPITDMPDTSSAKAFTND